MAKREPRKHKDAGGGGRKRTPKVLHIFHWQERYERESWQEGMPFIKHIIGSGSGSTEANQFLGQLKELRALVGSRYHHIRSVYYEIAGLAAAAQAGYRGYLLNECFGPLDERRLAARLELSLAETREALEALLAVNLIEKVDLPEFGEKAARPVGGAKGKGHDDPDDPARTKRAPEEVIDSKCAQDDANDSYRAQDDANDSYRAQAFAHLASQANPEPAKNAADACENADLEGKSGLSDTVEDAPKITPPLSTKTKGQVQDQDQASAGADECQTSKRANSNGQDGQGQAQGEAQGQAQGPSPGSTATAPTATPSGGPGPGKPQGVTGGELRGQTHASVVRTPPCVRPRNPGDAWPIGAVIGTMEHRYNLEALAFAEEIFSLLCCPFDREGREAQRERGNFAAAWQSAVDARLSASALHELRSKAREDAGMIAKSRQRYYKGDGSPEQYWRFKFNQHLDARRGPP